MTELHGPTTDPKGTRERFETITAFCLGHERKGIRDAWRHGDTGRSEGFPVNNSTTVFTEKKEEEEMNESDLIAAGFTKSRDGQWVKDRRLSPGNPRTFAKLESDPRHGALGQVQVQAPLGKRVLVRVTSFRRELLDEDNLCEKFVVDCCRYSRIISEDSPGEAKIEVSQEKVGRKEREFVRVEVWR